MAAKKKKAPPTEIMVVNDVPGEECRIAIIEDNHLEELYSERNASATKVGNIYKGRVVNVEPAIQAAFIDYGEGANGFLHISDLHPRYFPGGERVERVGRKIPRRERPAMQEALRRGDEVLVQVLKEGIGTKGPTLTSYLSIPGRMIVLMPGMDRVGVSRKLEDDEGRRESRKVLDTLDLPDGFGFILRTAGVGKTKTDLKRDVAYLMRLWKVMEKRIDKVGAPCELYTESDLLIRTVRDVLRPGIKTIVVDSASAHERISAFLQVVAPRSSPEVVRYRRRVPIFHAFDIERQIDLIHSREVPLPSGGRLVIDQTEALVAIDVNSGKSRSARDSETNAYLTNCEAVDEICRQLRLRDLGGLIIHDLIDMRHQRHRRQIEERFEENLRRDRARSTILKISEFGLVEMTRQRMRPSMRKAHFVTCPQCDGHGEVQSPDSVAADIARHIGFLLEHGRVRRVEVVCSPRVASVLLSRKRRELVRLEDASGKIANVRVSDDIAADRVDYYAYDERNADIDVDRLPASKPPTLADLLAEDERAVEAGEDEEVAVAQPAGGRRRRRRRRSGPADATAIALAGGFDDFEDDDDEAAETSAPAAESGEESTEGGGRKRRRRRRRRKSSDEGAATPVTTGAGDEGDAESRGGAEAPAEPEVEPPAPPAPPVLPEKPMRVHALAKELGVRSREIIDRCLAEIGLEVKNHMSSLAPELIVQVQSWFVPEPPPAAEPTPEAAEVEGETGADEDAPRPRRRRRRRGGRGRRSGRSGEGIGEGGEEAAAPEESASDDAGAASESEADAGPTSGAKTTRPAPGAAASDVDRAAAVAAGGAVSPTRRWRPGPTARPRPKAPRRPSRTTTREPAVASGRGAASGTARRWPRPRRPSPPGTVPVRATGATSRRSPRRRPRGGARGRRRIPRRATASPTPPRSRR